MAPGGRLGSGGWIRLKGQNGLQGDRTSNPDDAAEIPEDLGRSCRCARGRGRSTCNCVPGANNTDSDRNTSTGCIHPSTDRPSGASGRSTMNKEGQMPCAECKYSDAESEPDPFRCRSPNKLPLWVSPPEGKVEMFCWSK